jgi:hypothetical protein
MAQADRLREEGSRGPPPIYEHPCVEGTLRGVGIGELGPVWVTRSGLFTLSLSQERWWEERSTLSLDLPPL